MKKYFLYELKRNLFVIGFLTIAATIIYVIPLLMESKFDLSRDVGLATISVIGGVLAVAMPVWIFEYKMKKRSVDLFYALPLSHTKILVTKFLFGLVAIFIPYTAAYWIGALTVIFKAWERIDAVWYLPQFFGSILPIYILYAMSAFVFTRANKTLDGIVFILFWFLVATTVAFTIMSFVPYDSLHYVDSATGIYFNSDTCAYYFMPFKPLDRLTVVMDGRITKYYYNEYYIGIAEKVSMIVSFTLYALLAAGATAGLILTEKRTKAENVGQVSESWFGYKTMLPLYSFCLPVIANIMESLSEFALIIIYAVAMFALTILYKRNIRIGKKQAIIFAVSIVAGIIVSIVKWLILYR